MKMPLNLQIWSVSRNRVMTFEILIQHGTTLFHLRENYPKIVKMRTRKSVQLQTILAVYEQETNQDRSSLNYQKLKTMVRTRNFKVTNERIETVLVNSERGKLSSLKGHQDANR